MKRMLSVLLCFALVFTCSAAFAETAFDYTGIWSIIAVDEGGQIKTANEAGVPDMTMALEADGTNRVYSVMLGEDSTGTWRAADGGVITTDGSGTEVFFALDGEGRLVSEDTDRRVILSRFSTYCGTWTLRFGVNGGKTFSVSEMGTDLTIVLQEGGACAMRSKGRTITGTWTEEEGGVTIDAMGMPVFFAFENGILSSEENGFRLCLARDIGICANAPAEAFTGKWELIDAYDGDTAYTKEAIEEGLTFELNDDGVVRRESLTKGDGANHLTWTMQEVEGLGTVATIREHSGDTYLDYEVYILESGYIKIWNKESRYQIYRRIAE